MLGEHTPDPLPVRSFYGSQDRGRFPVLTWLGWHAKISRRWIIMTRRARQVSSTGIYHVMLRGINQQQILEDREDNERFIKILADCKAINDRN